jgi:outer membrane protein
MNFLRATALTFLATVVTATAAAPKFALVRVKDIYAQLPSTAALQQQLKQERDNIGKDPRAEGLRKIIGELQSLQGQLSDKASPLDEATSRKLSRTYEIKRQEAQTLQEDYEHFKADREKAINKSMVTAMRASLDRISKASVKIAKERGFDGLFDSSGETNTGIPFLIYSKNAPDLTPDIQAMLRDSEPTVPIPVPMPKPPTIAPKNTSAGQFD